MHDLQQGACRRFGHHARLAARLGRTRDGLGLSVGADVVQRQAWRVVHAVGCDGGEARSELDWCDRQALAERVRGKFDFAPVRDRPQDSTALARQAEIGRSPKTEAVESAPQRLFANAPGDFHRADVARILEHLGGREHALGVIVANVELADGHLAHLAVETVLGANLAGVQGGSEGKRLKRRARFERVGDGAVACAALGRV